MDCKQETRFSVFVTASDGWEGFSASYSVEKENPTLADTIEHAALPAFGCTFTPVAWMNGYPEHSDGDRAESIAAGRLIEKTPSGWVALGAEKQEPKPVETLGELLRQVLERPVVLQPKFIGMDYAKPIPGYHKRVLEPVMHPADARMIARDGPARIAIPKPLRLTVRVQSTAKPNPFPNTLRSPDCSTVPDHLNASRHQMAGMKG